MSPAYIWDTVLVDNFTLATRDARMTYDTDLQKHLDPLNIGDSWIKMLQNFSQNPQKLCEINAQYWTKWMQTLQNTTERFDENSPLSRPPHDRRFSGEAWDNNPFFDLLRHSYLMTCDWAEKTIADADGLSAHEKEKLTFTAQLYANAFSPSNFPHTNPEVLHETIKTGGQNLIKGFHNWMHDLSRGQGELSISTTQYDAFTVGGNLAATQGGVVYENAVMQLIQYAPTTPHNFKRPLLIVPPMINKYYILDLSAKNSFVKWACDQGHTVFMVSWIAPSAQHASLGFETYMHDGVITALNQINTITGEPSVNAIGYCLGGTLLTATLAYLHAQGQESIIESTTLLTTLLDFEHAGDLKLFLDDTQIEALDAQMDSSGVFDAKILQTTFRLLRSNDMIWSFVVNNYLMGRDPFPFDLLYWNEDSIHMTAALQKFCLKSLYRDNQLCKPGGVTVNSTPLDLSTIQTPCYFLSTKEDHIAPWRATYSGANLIPGDVRFTLADSGHIAGVVNPPAKKKYCYWTNTALPPQYDSWLDGATRHEGSWWNDWQTWIEPRAGKRETARTISAPIIEPAPGRYVRTP